ncbi:UNVERIFIED_CONTAM: hypothetical protein GTU68_048461 [Idotea baltica]|nr:hypothetical protein [Idotea baltica]
MRVKTGIVRRRRHNKVVKQASGFRGRRNNCFKLAKDAVERSLQHAYAGRKEKKRDFRKLWIMRINAAARLSGLSYSKLIFGLKEAGIDLNRKMLSEIAINDPEGFTKIAERAKAAL